MRPTRRQFMKGLGAALVTMRLGIGTATATDAVPVVEAYEGQVITGYWFNEASDLPVEKWIGVSKWQRDTLHLIANQPAHGVYRNGKR